MGTSIAKYDHVAVLTVKDDLAGEALEDFRVRTEQCIAEACYCIVVDCSAVGVFDSGGLETLLELQDKCEEKLGSVKLCSMDESISKVLEITRLKRRFETFPDVDAAVRSFS
jgi:anti-anti-sigma factor